jgi:NIMA (never in mitosis gene a)-related kinase
MNISRRVKPGELIKTTIGTPYYLSPEVWRRTEYDWKVDIWSLGVIAYEMAMLELPFPAETRGELERRVLGGRFREIGNQYSGELRGLICEMMRKEPDGRPCPSEVISRCSKMLADM